LIRSRLRGFGTPGLFAIAAIVAGALIGPPVAAILVLVWARLSRTPLSAFGFSHPRSWGLTLAAGAALGAATKIVLKAIVMPLLGAPAVNARYHYLAGNTAALPGIVLLVLVSAAFGEEVLFRGYLFERFGRLFGESRGGRLGAVALSAALFALAHYPDQGVPGVQQAAVTGLLFGGLFAWRRNIWFVMAAHAAFDLVAIALIYWSLEESVAHAVVH
jgi:membrane protease YdiL (CAAX protease family)